MVELAAALEDRFDIVIEDEDFTGEVFESVGTLTDFIDDRRTGGSSQGRRAVVEMRVVWRSLRRRWYLVLALAVLTLGATFLVAQRVGETYEATGTVLVFPPSQAEDPTGAMTQENPYLSLGGVDQARDVVVRALTSKKIADEFGETYPGRHDVRDRPRLHQQRADHPVHRRGTRRRTWRPRRCTR